MSAAVTANSAFEVPCFNILRYVLSSSGFGFLRQAIGRGSWSSLSKHLCFGVVLTQEFKHHVYQRFVFYEFGAKHATD